MRTMILGVPEAGKTFYANYLADNFKVSVIHTDDFIKEYEWGQRAVYIAGLMLQEPPWIIEGCDAVRGLRKCLEFNPDRKPAEKVLWFDSPRKNLSPRQLGFAKGLRKIFAEIQPQLERLGVEVEITL